MVSVIACGIPLYGTSTTSSLPMVLSRASDTCEPEEPYPAESLPGCARTWLRKSVSLRAGKSGRTISMNDVVPRRAIGAKSFTGS